MKTAILITGIAALAAVAFKLYKKLVAIDPIIGQYVPGLDETFANYDRQQAEHDYE